MTFGPKYPNFWVKIAHYCPQRPIEAAPVNVFNTEKVSPCFPDMREPNQNHLVHFTIITSKRKCSCIHRNYILECLTTARIQTYCPSGWLTPEQENYFHVCSIINQQISHDNQITCCLAANDEQREATTVGHLQPRGTAVTGER